MRLYLLLFVGFIVFFTVTGQEITSPSSVISANTRKNKIIEQQGDSLYNEVQLQYQKIYSTYDESEFKFALVSQLVYLVEIVNYRISLISNYRFSEIKDLEKNNILLYFSSKDFLSMKLFILEKYKILLKEYEKTIGVLKSNKIRLNDDVFFKEIVSLKKKFFSINDFCQSFFEIVDNSISVGKNKLDRENK